MTRGAAPLPDTSTETGPVCDFVGGAFGHRLRGGFGRREPLARALGLKASGSPADPDPAPPRRIVDATAGFGRDGMLVASLGLPLTMIERSPVMHAALRDGLARAAEASDTLAAIVARITLLHGDARDLLPTLEPDLVLVDPMHPPRPKSALVKKGMRDLREVVGADPDAAALIEAALAAARRRVVLKWPLRAPLPDGVPSPSHAILSKTLRFDVFVRPRSA